ncbi:MAG: hypothetical protein O7I42_12975 [Alphaproteobacteria bacterium]|nr:hypothetical protein [Alphaproteobacteria bacterium]
MIYTGSLRGDYYLQNPSKSEYCAELPPDVALSTLRSIAVKGISEDAGIVGGAASFDGTVTSKAIELAGQSHMILATRELLYRLRKSSNKIDKTKLRELLDKSTSATNESRALEYAKTPALLRRLLLAATGKTRD